MSIVVYQIGSLGDTVVSLPAYKAIRRHFGPSAPIRVLHNAPKERRAAPHQVLEGSGLVDGSLSFPQTGGRDLLKVWIDLRKRLRASHVDTVVYLAPAERPPAAVRRDRLFFRLCGIRKLIGFHACDPALFAARDAEGRVAAVQHEASLRLGRLRADGIEAEEESDLMPPLLCLPDAEVALVRERIEAKRRYPRRRLVAICPGANQPANLWPRDRFLEIGLRLIALGRYEPIVVGGQAEQVCGEQMVAVWGAGVNLAGHLSVSGSAAALSRCAFMVGLDTGTTHLAAAVGVRCVALYGDRNAPGQWTPLGDGHILLQNRVRCGGCKLSVCPIPGHPCMSGIGLEEVWSAILQMEQAGYKPATDHHTKKEGVGIEKSAHHRDHGPGRLLPGRTAAR